MADEDDFLLEDEDDTPQEPQAPEQPTEGAEGEGGTEQQPDPLADIKAQLAGLSAKGDVGAQLAPLIEMGKQFLANQNRPAAAPASNPQQDDAQIEALGKQIQETLITGDPKAAARLLAAFADDIATRRVGEALQQHGAPMAEKAGDYAFRAFLETKRDDAGETGLKTHAAVVKELALTPQERTWLATAPIDQANRYLEGRYEQAAGKLLLRSSKTARPKNLGGGSGGAGGNVSQFPGADQRHVRQLQKLAAEWYPNDPKRQAEEVKKAIEAAGGA